MVSKKKPASKSVRERAADELILTIENVPGWIFLLEGPFHDYFADKRSKGTYDAKKAVVYLRNNYVRPAIRYYKKQHRGWTKADFERQPWRDMRNLTEADENTIARYFRDRLLDDYDLKKVRKGSVWRPIRKLGDYERREIVEVRR